jgi:hypothetical protein
MFVIVQDNFVIDGPRDWNKKKFEEVLLEDCEVDFTLETRNESNLPIVVSYTVKILPVTKLPDPVFNSKTQILQGPFWNLSDTVAEAYYTAQDMPVDAVKNFLTSIIANARYIKETAGIKMTIQGIEVSVDTARGSRDIFFQAFLSIGETETMNWKFPETWLELTKSDLGLIVSAGRNHIQTSFDWENGWVNRVSAAVTLDDLNTLYNELETELRPQTNLPL